MEVALQTIITAAGTIVAIVALIKSNSKDTTMLESRITKLEAKADVTKENYDKLEKRIQCVDDKVELIQKETSDTNTMVKILTERVNTLLNLKTQE